jgi:cytochrome c-type biogenesis protein
MIVESSIAFAAGVVSFASPCHLPIIPVWVGYVVGGAEGRRRSARNALAQALAFVLGFSFVFVVLWASIAFVGFLFQAQAGWLRIAGGALLIVIGLHVAGLVQIPWLTRTVAIPGGRVTKDANSAPPTLARSALLGVIFAAGWTPCVGPTLGAIIGMASLRGTVTQGALLLLVYSIGMGIPFILVALGADALRRRLRWFTRHAAGVSLVTGGLLIVVGFLMISGLVSKLNQFLPQWVV